MSNEKCEMETTQIEYQASNLAQFKMQRAAHIHVQLGLCLSVLSFD